MSSNSMKKFSSLFLFVALAVLPFVSFAQATVDMEYNTAVAASLTGNIYTITTGLSVDGVSSYNGLTFLVIRYANPEMPPSNVSILTSISQSASQPNNFNVSINSTYNPTGFWYQFALVDTATLSSTGISSFDPSSSDVFQTFAITAPVEIVVETVEDDAGDGVFTGGDVPGSVDSTNCESGIDSTNCENEIDSTNCEGGIDSTICEPPISFLETTTVANPLGQDVDILGFLDQLFENFVKIALPILVLFAVYSGLLFVMARGNEEKLSDAKKNFFYVIIGSVIVFGAWAAANILAGTVEQFEAFNSIMKLLV